MSTALSILRDSGPPVESTDYTTVVLLHGFAWHSGIFAKFLPLAAAQNARIVLVNRRDYPGATPFSAEDHALLEAAMSSDTPAAHAQLVSFTHQRATEVCDLLARFVQDNKIPLAQHAENKGGIILGGWSFGTMWMSSFLAHAPSVPVGNDGVPLSKYVRRVVFYDPPYHVLGFAPPPEPHTYNPLFDPAIAPEDQTRVFSNWVSGYYAHRTDAAALAAASAPASVSDTGKERAAAETFEVRTHLAAPPPTLSTLSPDELAAALFPSPGDPGGSDSRLVAGGIRTSGLQLNSLLYRFHPGVLWSCTFPKRNEILREARRIWEEYQLEPRTRFDTRVTSVKRVPGTAKHLSDPTASDSTPSRWTINDGRDGEFDAVVVTIGTCGAPKRIDIPGLPRLDGVTEARHEEKHRGGKAGEVFEGEVFHSIELDKAKLKGKTVLVVGSGASGVEAVETALAKGAKHCVMIARKDKWVIPRNILLDTLIAAQPFGRQMPFSFLWEKIIVMLNYRGAPDLVPARVGIFEDTPVVNDKFVRCVRQGKCEYVRGDIQRLTRNSIRVSVRNRDEMPGEGKETKEYEGDVLVLATGFQKPNITFLQENLFPEGYERPNLYLQNFSTEDWSVLMTNSAYVNAIGTVGHFHIGIYMRILLTFLLDPDVRPTPKDMKLWVDNIRFLKRGARGGALSFFTYMELTIWLLLFHVLRIDRLKWVFFIMQGWGVYPKEFREGTVAQAKEKVD